MSLDGLNPSPLNVDAGYPAKIRGQLAEIMTPGPALADEGALIDLCGMVADALHTGVIDFADHDTLIGEIGDARMSLI